jgi:hypothetical protein
MVAPAMHPATDGDLLTNQRFIYLSAIVASHLIFQRFPPAKVAGILRPVD